MKQARDPEMPPRLSLPLSSRSQVPTDNTSLPSSACQGRTDGSTSSAVFFPVSQVCAWILSGWQTSSVCTGIPCLCWQVCLHNYFFKKNSLFTLLDTITGAQPLPGSSARTIMPWKTWPGSCRADSEFDLHQNQRELCTKKEGVIKSLWYKYLN